MSLTGALIFTKIETKPIRLAAQLSRLTRPIAKSHGVRLSCARKNAALICLTIRQA